MMFLEYLYGVSEWILFLVFVVILIAAVECGFLWGRHLADHRSPDARGRIAAVGGTLSGFLALLLGFTFAMSLSRYNARRDAFQNEVNDLGTVFTQTSLLPPAQANETRARLGDYAALRVHAYWWERAPAELAAISEATDALQDRIWACAVAAAHESALPAPITAIYLNNLTRAFSDRTERALEINNHVPEAIIWLLLFIAVIAVATTGYASGLNKARAPLVRSVMILSIALTLLVIVDLDRPRRGLIRIDQRAMAELRDDIFAKNRAAGLPIPAIPADEVIQCPVGK